MQVGLQQSFGRGKCNCCYSSFAMQQFIAWCALLLLLSLTVVRGDGPICSYEYELQPAGTMENEGCSLEGFHQMLKLKCQVSGGNDPFTIQWHYSSEPPTNETIKAAVTVINRDSGVHLSIESQLLSEVGTHSMASELSIDVGETTNDYSIVDGYFWCSVNSNVSSNVPMLDNPSQIVHISTQCFLVDDPMQEKCSQMLINLSERVDANDTRCADFPTSIDIVNAWDSEQCVTEEIKPSTSTAVAPDNMSTSTDKMAATGGETNNQDEQTTMEVSPASSGGLSVQYAWIGVGIAMVLLLAVIVVTLFVIVFLVYRKNKVKVSSSQHNNITNPYIEYSNPDTLKRETFALAIGPTTTDRQHPGSKVEQNGTEVQYDTITNVIHAQNLVFDGNGSPDSKGSPRTTNTIQVSLSSTGEYEYVTTELATRGSVKASQRHQYDQVESEELPDYSHLQHAHGGSQKRKFSITSNGTRTLPSSYNNRERTSSSMPRNGVSHPQPIFDSPEYMSIDDHNAKRTHTLPKAATVGEDSAALGYSRINHGSVKGTNSTNELRDLAGEDYHQLPSAFTDEANDLVMNQQGHGNSPEGWNEHTTIASHPSAHRHNSATVNGTVNEYASIDPNGVKKRNAYSFSITSTDDFYISERGHLYHVLERTDKEQQKSSGSNGKSPRFRIQENGSRKGKVAGGAGPAYSNVIRSSKQSQEKQNEQIGENDESEDPTLEHTGDSKTIPVYSQVDKTKKTKNQPQVEELDSDNHHYHVLENSEPTNSHDTHHYHIPERPSRSEDAVWSQDPDTHHYHIPECSSQSENVPQSHDQDTHHYHILEQPGQANNSTGSHDQGTNQYHTLEQPSNATGSHDQGTNQYHTLEQPNQPNNAIESHDYHVLEQPDLPDNVEQSDTHHYHVLEGRVEEQDKQKTNHHYHVLEQHSNREMIEDSFEGGPIYHTIERER